MAKHDEVDCLFYCTAATATIDQNNYHLSFHSPIPTFEFLHPPTTTFASSDNFIDFEQHCGNTRQHQQQCPLVWNGQQQHQEDDRESEQLKKRNSGELNSQETFSQDGEVSTTVVELQQQQQPNSVSKSKGCSSSSSRRRRRKKSSYKHVPHAEKPPQLVAKRNARERKRVHAVNLAFVRLRKAMPLENKRGKRVSKVKVLQRAISYIRNLHDMVSVHDGLDPLEHKLGLEEYTFAF